MYINIYKYICTYIYIYIYICIKLAFKKELIIVNTNNLLQNKVIMSHFLIT